MSEQQHPDPLEERVEERVNEFKQNFPLSDETARAAAEDSAHHTVPSPSAEAVENERIRRAQELLGEP
jgi:hypothetical protein